MTNVDKLALEIGIRPGLHKLGTVWQMLAQIYLKFLEPILDKPGKNMTPEIQFNNMISVTVM